MEILYQLGLNKTFFYQITFFLISALFLWRFLFVPYLRIMEIRKHKTTGATEGAASIIAATEELAIDYEGKTKGHHARIHAVSAEYKKQGAQEEEAILTAARTNANEILKQNQKLIKQEVDSARQELEKQIPVLAATIASKVLGRELQK